MELGKHVNMCSSDGQKRQFPVIEELSEDDDVPVVYPEPIWEPDVEMNDMTIIPADEDTTVIREHARSTAKPQDSMITRISKVQSTSFIKLGLVLGQAFKDAGKVLQDSIQKQQDILIESGIKLNIKVPDKVKKQLMKPQSKMIVGAQRGDVAIDTIAEMLALIGTEMIRRQSRVSSTIHQVPVVCQAYDVGMSYLRGFASFYGMLAHVGMSAVDAAEETVVETIRATVNTASHMFGDDIGEIAEETTMMLVNTYMMTTSVRTVLESKRIMERLVNQTVARSAANIGEAAINEAIANVMSKALGADGPNPEAGQEVNSLIRNIAAMLAGTSMETGEDLPDADTEGLLSVTFDDVE
ncbi:hypothetical protein J8273_2865 [Carpediemonas membranifera]|uniref:Uncharacterized protein n=1 Tax=Carpediemonas membranifera TaxID=201153 RepID=A0A8J6BZL9_9EUKA|nr:hypothetical protein J8273_2865 [Carpediemonas membranifera]|eukprot:KAG9395661.1 hypothetical protein J8273_2865 [Carpediemonas membranifera]